MSQDDVIFREVDEELRRERMHSLWRRFGPYVIAAAVLVVLLVAANEGWKWWRNGASAQASDQFYAALKLSDGGDLAGADAALQKIEGEGGGYAVLASFKQASLLVKQGKKAEAVAAYDALASNQSDVRLRELALVMAANILVDTGSLGDVQSRVSSLVSVDSPMRNAAREAIGLAQYKAGDLAGATKTFTDITADPNTPRDLQSRIQLYLAQLISDAPAATPAPAATSAPDAAATPATPPETSAAPVTDTTTPATDAAPAADQPLGDASSMMQMMAPSAAPAVDAAPPTDLTLPPADTLAPGTPVLPPDATPAPDAAAPAPNAPAPDAPAPAAATPAPDAVAPAADAAPAPVSEPAPATPPVVTPATPAPAAGN
ncbi:MAG TPA: tetratricopeptide repeat protein [Devosiaceae bacterium]|jgi:hypothetical protein